MRFIRFLSLRGLTIVVLVAATGASAGGCFAGCQDHPGSATCEEYCGLHCSNDGAPKEDCTAECARIEPLNEQSSCDDEFDEMLDCLGAAPHCGEVECLGPVASYEGCVLDFCSKNDSSELCKSASTSSASASSTSGSGGSGGGGIGGGAAAGCEPITGADGAGEVLAADQRNPEGITLDSARVYWTAQGASDADGAIRSLPLSGGAVEDVATGQATPTQLVLAGGSLYWTNGGTYDGAEYLSDGAVMTIPLGGGPPAALATSLKIPAGIAVGGGFVYWASEGTTNLDGSVYNDNGSVARIAVGGGAIQTLAEGASLRVPYQVAVDAKSIYWGEVGIAPAFADGHLRAAPLAGGAVKTLDAEATNGVALDDGFVYWGFSGTEAGGFADGAILRMSKTGGERTVLASGVCRPSRVAVDGSHVYWTTRIGGAVFRVPLSGGAPELLASGLARPANLAIGANEVYWTNNGTAPDYADGSVMRLAK